MIATETLGRGFHSATRIVALPKAPPAKLREASEHVRGACVAGGALATQSTGNHGIIIARTSLVRSTLVEFPKVAPPPPPPGLTECGPWARHKAKEASFTVQEVYNMARDEARRFYSLVDASWATPKNGCSDVDDQGFLLASLRVV